MTRVRLRSPRERLFELARTIGEAEAARWCAGLLEGTITFDDSRRPSLVWLGGPHAEKLLLMSTGGLGVNDYWPRVWGARGLMYVWTAEAEAAVRHGLADPAWRVREMSAKVVRLREVSDADSLLASATSDVVPRVRASALLALARVGELEHAPLMEHRREDSDAAVRRAARTALAALAKRLDYDAGRVTAKG